MWKAGIDRNTRMVILNNINGIDMNLKYSWRGRPICCGWQLGRLFWKMWTKYLPIKSLKFEVTNWNVIDYVQKAAESKNSPWNKGYFCVSAWFYCGAEGETRTPTRKPSLDPEPSASTSSATSARKWKLDFWKKIDLITEIIYIFFFKFSVKCNVQGRFEIYINPVWVKMNWRTFKR